MNHDDSSYTISIYLNLRSVIIQRPNSPQIYGVVLGEHSASGYSPNEQMRDVDKIIRHRQFSTASFNNDIVLLKVIFIK